MTDNNYKDYGGGALSTRRNYKALIWIDVEITTTKKRDAVKG